MISRTPFYGLTLFTAVLQTFFGFYAGFVNGSSPFLYIFGKLAAGFSIVTWTWVSVLMSYNRRPFSTHALSRSLAHFASFVILGVVWLALGIMLATQLPHECNADTVWCAAAGFSSALAFLTAIFAFTAAYLVSHAAQASGAGFEINVAQASQMLSQSQSGSMHGRHICEEVGGGGVGGQEGLVSPTVRRY